MINRLLRVTVSNATVAPSDYLEFAWVCAPNAAGQSITANTITTLTVDTKVSDTSNSGDMGAAGPITGANTGLSLSGNEIGLKAGTYYFEAEIPNGCDTDDIIISIYNVTDAIYISRRRYVNNGPGGNINYSGMSAELKGQFTISASKVLSLRMLASASLNVGAEESITDSTAGADQRTTIKLWKLA